MKLLLTVAAVLTFALGVAWLAFPHSMLAGWGVRTDPVGAYMGRRYGGLFFGYAVILWTARRTTATNGPSTGILGGGAVVTAVLAVVSVAGAVVGIVGPGVWSAAAIEATLAAGFLYYWLRSWRTVKP